MPSGTIVYCSREDHIPPPFAKALAQLAQRHPDAKIEQMVSNDIADARNQAVLQAEGDWLWFIDTDMLFAPTTLERLLAHQVDVVQVFCLKRHPPHEPLVYELEDGNGTTGAVLKGRMPVGPAYLKEVPSCGAGGTLYRKRVFETLPGPWFVGICGTEDTSFALRMRLAGFRLWVDLATPAYHLTPVLVSPHPVGTSWQIRYTFMNGQHLTFPTEPTRLVVPAPALTRR
jgi:hypothetical protein